MLPSSSTFLVLALAAGASAFTVDSYLGACSSASRGMPLQASRSYAPGSWAPPSSAPTTMLEPIRAAASSAVEEVVEEVSEPVVMEQEEAAVAEGFAKPDIWIKEDFSEFSMAPAELLEKAKEFLSEPGFVEQGKWMSDTDFTFLGPVVGPLGKEAYLKAIGGFDVFSIFPDLNPNYYGLTVDPMEEGRVWAISRMTGTTHLSVCNPCDGFSMSLFVQTYRHCPLCPPSLESDQHGDRRGHSEPAPGHLHHLRQGGVRDGAGVEGHQVHHRRGD